jgi:TonB family protein
MTNVHSFRPVPNGSDEINLQIDDTRNEQVSGDTDRQISLLVLSRDTGLVETVRNAAPRSASVTHSPDLDRVAEELRSLQPGVLLIDTASTADAAAMLPQLTLRFPGLVIVAAGKREDSAALMQLTAAGQIFRFLLTPLLHGQTRLALEAAIAHHIDLKAAGQPTTAGPGGGDTKNRAITYGALAAGVLIAIGAIWFGMTMRTVEPKVAPAAQQPATTSPPLSNALPGKPDPVQAEIALAKEAFSQGRYLEPRGESALDLYRNAIALDPGNEAARAGVRSVVDKILDGAEAALTAEHLEEAIRSIETARDIDATHPRLLFLDTQVARERERLKLSQVRDVGKRVRALIEQASDRMQRGRFITPAGGSARDALAEASRLDPTDPMVAQGVRDLNASLTEEARKSLAAGRTDEAQTFVNAARQLGSAGPAFAAVERALADAMRSAASAPASADAGSRRPATAAAAGSGPNIDAMVAQVRQRLNEGSLIDPAGASAQEALSALRDAAPARPEVDELSRTLSTRLLEANKQALAAKAYDRSAQLIAGARDVGVRYNEAALAEAERDLVAARERETAGTVLQAATVPRTREVPAIYPTQARVDETEGWVDIDFTISPEGIPRELAVRDAKPRRVFDRAALNAVQQWRFQPIVRNGEAVAQRATLRVRFEMK